MQNYLLMVESLFKTSATLIILSMSLIRSRLDISNLLSAEAFGAGGRSE